MTPRPYINRGGTDTKTHGKPGEEPVEPGTYVVVNGDDGFVVDRIPATENKPPLTIIEKKNGNRVHCENDEKFHVVLPAFAPASERTTECPECGSIGSLYVKWEKEPHSPRQPVVWCIECKDDGRFGGHVRYEDIDVPVLTLPTRPPRGDL